jgi:hypothetical protein
MKCRLCGQPTAGPDKLCGDCNRALRRAREGSAALRTSPVAAPKSEDATSNVVAAAPLASISTAQPNWRRIVAWGAAGMVAIGIVYLVQRVPDQKRPREPVAVDSVPVETAGRRNDEPAPESSPMNAKQATPRVMTAEVVAPAAPPQTKAPLKAAQGPAAPATTQVSARPKPTSKAAPIPANPETNSGGATSPYTLASDAAPRNSNAGPRSDAGAAQQLARANVPQPAATKDGAQVLASALERCHEEKFLAGVICEQKARLQYCEGKWGQVPQCTSKSRVD